MIEDLILFTFAVLIGLFAGAAFWSGSFDAAEKQERRRIARWVDNRVKALHSKH
jgi:hypothetical protein